MDYRNSRRKPIQLGDDIGHGGEAVIYRIANQPKLLAKIYSQTPRKDYARKLIWMRDHPPVDPTAAQQHASLAWPLDLIFNSKGQLSGYLMPYIEHAVPLLDVFNPRRCADVLPEFNLRYLHRTARNLASALGALHACGYVVGDLNESNILVTPRALVTMIDIDSFQVRETSRTGSLIHICPVARLEYTPPELQGKSLQNTERTPEQDAFGLGVLIYQLLLAGNHPFRAQWLGSGDPPPLEERIRRGCFPFRNPPVCPVAPPPFTHGPDILFPSVSDLVMRCFVDGHRQPQHRPTPQQWEQAIAIAEENLTVCQNGHYYSNHQNACPVCNPRYPGRQVPLPPAAELRPARQPSGQVKKSSSASTPAKALPISNPKKPGGNPSPGAVLHQAPGQAVLTGGLGRIGLPKLSFKSLIPVTSSVTRRTARFTRQSLLRSLGKGALLGATSGALGGGLYAMVAWGISRELLWSPLIVVGAVLAATWRSWQIGLGISFSILRTVGWEIVLKVVLGLLMAGSGGFVGWLVGTSLLAVLIGIFMGVISGWLMGDALWNRSQRFRWDLIGAGLIIILLTWVTYMGINWIGESWLGKVTGRMISSLATWLEGNQVDRIWISALVGLLGGGAGGMLSGSLIEFLAELTGFRK